MAIEAERNLDMSFKLTNIFLNGSMLLTEVVSEILQYLNKDPAAKMLNNYMKNGGQLDFTVCNERYAKELEERLKDNGVVFLRTSAANKGAEMFVYADIDREKVNEVVAEFRADHEKDGIVDRSVFYAYAEGNVRQMTGLDTAQAMLITEHAEKRDMKLMVSETQKGIFTIEFAAKDLSKMNRIRTETAIELSGVAGKALRKQLEYESQNVVEIINKTNRGKETFYVVDLDGKEIKSDEVGVTYKGPEGLITVEHTEESFEERANELLQRMRGPVHLTEEQKHDFDMENNKKKFLVTADKENGRPSYTEEEYKAIREMAAKKELYEIKLSLLNPEQQVYDICIENDDMRLATFEEFNDINEKQTEEYENDEINPEIMNEIKESIRNMQDTQGEPIRDHELEEDILDGQEIERSEQLEEDLSWDASHDKNGNLIPDEYEV